jgi:acyl-CoA synthetase (AMP-forming)/AMP-acid ligase II
MNVYDTLRATAARTPDKLAIADDLGSLTFWELFEETERLRGFLASHGVGPGRGVALITRNNRYFIIGLYASIGCGAVVMPVSPQQQPDEIRTAVSSAQLHFILADDHSFARFGHGEAASSGDERPLFLSRTAKDLDERTVPFIDNVAFMRFTSGTTGSARCVILTHESALERIEAANEGLQITGADNVIWVLPMAYHFIVSLVLYIRFGAGIIVCEDLFADGLLSRIQDYGGTFLYGSPMHVRLLATYEQGAPIPSLRCVVSTTTAVNPDYCRLFRQRYGLPVTQAFGIIEVGLPVINAREAEQQPGAIGRALPAYEVGILDEHMNPMPSGSVGRFGLKGPGMFDGYLAPPTRRSQVLKNGWFVTGDYASSSADGLIELKGREKAMINVSGNKVFPDEVEAVINSFDGVRMSRVYGR